MQTSSFFKKVTSAGLLSLSLIGFSATSKAAPLNLLLAPAPDATAGFIQVDYNAGTDLFTASGYLLSLFDGTGSTDFTANSTFDITATIDNSGNLTSGTFTAFGALTDVPPNPEVTLMIADIIAFGFDGPGSVLEFEFSPTGGAVVGILPPGATGGIILSGSGFAGTFENNFGNVIDGQADIAPIASVPVPAAIFLFAPALIGLFAAKRKSA